MDKAVLTCALTGVLTDPAVYPAPVSPEEMAREARRAFDEGASVVHVHFRRLEPRLGHLPSWDPKVATAVVSAIRDACPGIIVNQTTGVVGSDITGPLKCLAAVRPEIAALNAGSLNYLKTRADGSGHGRRCCSTIRSTRLAFLARCASRRSSRSSSVSTLASCARRRRSRATAATSARRNITS